MSLLLRNAYTRKPRGGAMAWLTSNAGAVARAEFFGATAVAGSQIKVWLGASWVAKPLKRWDGTAWVAATLKFWNGSAWVVV